MSERIRTLQQYQEEMERTAQLRAPLDERLRRLDMQYVAEKLRAAGIEEADRIVANVLRWRSLDLGAMGLAGEVGEVVDILKKHVHHNKPLDLSALKEELGDVFWYLAYCCEVVGTTLEEVANINAKKLRDRFPQGFTTHDANARADKSRPLRVYVASSWRNTYYPHVRAMLAERGFSVMDWREGDQPLGTWGAADERFGTATLLQTWSPPLAVEAARHPKTIATFAKDMKLLDAADALVLLTPCGRSAHLEAGIAFGRKMPCAVLYKTGAEPEVMTAGMVPIADELDLVEWLADVAFEKGLQVPAVLSGD